ncbi:MAG: hypothetical protein ABSH25_22125 [Syntrophorhabdales bacterium]|jgi:transposase InsO family protein
MTVDTTFKEFVEEHGIDFSLLEVGSRRHRNLVEAFNKAKFKLEAEEEAREYEEYEKIRVRLMLKEQPATANARSRCAQPPKSGAPFAGSQP